MIAAATFSLSVLRKSRPRFIPRRTVADAVENLVVTVAYQSLLRESLDSGVFCNAAGTGDADDFTLQIVELRDTFGADECVIHVGLHAADNDDRRALDDRAHGRNPGHQCVIHISTDEGSDCGRPASDENRFDVQAFGREKAEIDSDE